jgi:hypothetical protein
MGVRFHKGILKKTETGWVICHSIVDPYGQVPNPIRLHHSYIGDLIDGKEIEFELKVRYEYYGELK